jgi:hypothetical protein
MAKRGGDERKKRDCSQSSYRPAIQQFVNMLRVTTLQQLDEMTALLQLVDKLATRLLQTHLVHKLRDFYVCTLNFQTLKANFYFCF